MAQNRHIPYGYRISNGRIITDCEEAAVIRRIYMRYAAGASYLTIARELTADGIRYIEGKPAWNKNMVARILQNTCYLGIDKYPAIIEEGHQQDVEAVRKPYQKTESQVIKSIKRFLVCDVCGNRVRRRTKTDGNERWYCESNYRHTSVAVDDSSLLLKISALIKKSSESEIQARTSEYDVLSFDIAKLQNQIDMMLSQEIKDEQEIRRLILKLASERYALCKKGDVADERINTALRSMTDKETTDISILHEIAKAITVDTDGSVTLILKNDQIIKEGDEEDGSVQT